MNIVKSIFLLFFVIALFDNEAYGQNDAASKLPIVTLEQDYNGVDVTSGSYIVRSPFYLASSAASKLGININFNGRSFGFSLNTYFKDETFTSYGFDANVRELTVVFEGRSFFFRCSGVGECVDINFLKDGSRLSRLSAKPAYGGAGEDRYRFTYRDGTVANFFDPTYTALQYCADDDGCNAAIYHAYAYASNIKYPSGELLTFQPLTTQGYDSDGVYRVYTNIQSNLGYTLKFATKMPANYVAPTKAGVFWQRQILADDEDIKVMLQENGTNILSVQAKRFYETLPVGGRGLKTFQQIDSTGRVSSWEFKTNLAVGCFYPNLDFRQTMVTKEITPGGVVTDIQYHDAVNRALQIWQVKSVRKGGRVWNYSYNEAGRSGVTATDGFGGKRTALPSEGLNPLSTGSGGCPAMIPSKPTKYTDALGRVTNVRLDNNSNEIAEVTYPNGHGYIYVRDPRSNILNVSEKPSNGGAPVIIYKANYASSCANAFICNKPNWTEDAKGNRTSYTYYDIHGGIKTRTFPPNREGIHRRDFYFYEAFNTGSGIVYRLNREESCGLFASQLNLTVCPATSETRVQKKTYWNKTFLPKTVTLTDGADSLPLVTTYTYNVLGLPTVVDGPRNDVDDKTYRTYDSIGRLIFEISPLPGGTCQNTGLGCRVRQMVKNYYNSDDKLTRIESGSGSSINGSDFIWSNAKRMSYDNAGLLIKTEELVP